MSTEPDLDRTTRAWLDAMPDEAPDHVIAAVLQAVERTPQVRRPLGVRLLRFPTMLRPALAAALVALAAISVLLVPAILRPSSQASGVAVSTPPSPATGPSAAPTTSATAASSAPTLPASTVPQALQTVWVAAPITDPVAGQVTRRTLTFGVTGLSLGGSSIGQGMLSSSATFSGPTLTLTSPAGGLCPAAATTSVAWSLSPGGSILTIGPAVDPGCPRRGAMLTGTWYRVACTNTSDACLGNLEAGTYATQFIDPRLKDANWSARWGAVTYTVPAGWANSGDWPLSFSLTPTADYANETANGTVAGKWHELDIWAQPAPVADTRACGTAAIDASVPKTPAGIAAWLATVPGLKATPPANVTVAGRPGVRLELSIQPRWTHACRGDPGPSVVLFVDRPTAGDDHSGGYEFGMTAGETVELTLLDIGSGDIVALIADSSYDRFPALVADGHAIFDTMQFH